MSDKKLPEMTAAFLELLCEAFAHGANILYSDAAAQKFAEGMAPGRCPIPNDPDWMEPAVALKRHGLARLTSNTSTANATDFPFILELTPSGWLVAASLYAGRLFPQTTVDGAPLTDVLAKMAATLLPDQI